MITQIQLNPGQCEALARIERFLIDPIQDAFVLCGSAGTGKTTLVAKIIELVRNLGMETRLVAPTGCAAKILQGKLNRLLPNVFGRASVSTLHSAIYQSAGLDVDETRLEQGHSAIQRVFVVKKHGDPFDLLIVDEASMVGDSAPPQSSDRYGTGRLLSDLVTYLQHLYCVGIVSRPIKVLFVGDPAQLPPVGSADSPALNTDYLNRRFGFQVRQYQLTTVMRQGEGSGILTLANQIRERIHHDAKKGLQISFNGRDVGVIDFHSALNRLANNIRHGRSCVAVTFKNQIALEYNLGLRAQLLGSEYAPITPGDRLLVMRNCPDVGLTNGDLVSVQAVMTRTREERVCLPDGEMVKFCFKELILQIDEASDERSVRVLVLENLLFSGRPKLDNHENLALYLLVKQRFSELDPDSAEFQDLLQTDPYYNALQVKFGYAMTCHKAQGGEWDEVIVDSMGVPADTRSGCRWTYTAVTRSSKQLWFVGN